MSVVVVAEGRATDGGRLASEAMLVVEGAPPDDGGGEGALPDDGGALPPDLHGGAPPPANDGGIRSVIYVDCDDGGDRVHVSDLFGLVLLSGGVGACQAGMFVRQRVCTCVGDGVAGV